MLTPRFTLEQDDKFVTVSIYAPFTHIAETEVFMDGPDFRFFSKPYFLRLHFPCDITESDDASAKFDADSCSYIIKCPKVTLGQFFPNLDMISELVKPTGSTSIDGQNIELVENDEQDWYFEQEFQDLPSFENRIGFGLKHENVFNKLLEECQEILDVKTPEKFTMRERRELRLESEAKDFDPNHYLCDLFEPDDTLKEALSLHPKEFPDKLSSEDNLKLTSYDKNVKFAVGLKGKVMNGLIDILYGYCYDLRTTFGEHSSESGWLISKLSSTLVCSSMHEDTKQCVVASLRRALIYPLHRHWELSLKVLDDVQALFRRGRVSILHCLLDIVSIFNESEGRYIFNQLYIDQYICWVQKLKDLESVADDIAAVAKEVCKQDLNLDLIEYESAAEMVQKEQHEAELVKVMEKVSLSSTTLDSDDSVGESADSDDDTETETETGDESDTDTETDQ